MIDPDNSIDMLICQTYAHNNDWPANNWRAARGDNAGQKWKFLIWDAEIAFRPGEQSSLVTGTRSPDPAVQFSDDQGVMQLHTGLKNYGPYKARFSSRLVQHFDTAGGVFAMNGASDGAVQLVQAEMAKFQAVLFCESARWGYMDVMSNPVSFTKSDTNYLVGKPYGDWDRNTSYLLNQWLPQRRTYYLSRMQTIGLYQP